MFLVFRYFTYLLNKKDVAVHYAANEGLLTSQQNIAWFPYYEHRARIHEMESSKYLQKNEIKRNLKNKQKNKSTFNFKTPK